MIAEGADIVDVGGESTRPGALPWPRAEELRRVLPVVEALAGQVRVSIDTRKAAVAEAAVAAGATIINDVSAALWPVAAEAGAGWVAMHMPADPSVMQQHAHYDDVVAEVRDHLVARAEAARRRRACEEMWIDPGIGFGKTAAHNLLLLRHLDAPRRHRLAGGGRHQPQDLPRAPDAGRRRRRAGAPTTAWRPRWPPPPGPSPTALAWSGSTMSPRRPGRAWPPRRPTAPPRSRAARRRGEPSR